MNPPEAEGPDHDGLDHDGPAPVGSSLDRVLRSLGGGDVGVLVGLAGRWEEVVGASLAARCRPASLEAGTLVIRVDDPAFVPELRFSARRIADAANALLGHVVVETVEARAGR